MEGLLDPNMHLFCHRGSRMHLSMWWMSGQGLNMSCFGRGVSGGLLLAPTWTSFSWTWPRDPVEWGRRWFGMTCFTFTIPMCLILSPTQALRLVYLLLTFYFFKFKEVHVVYCVAENSGCLKYKINLRNLALTLFYPNNWKKSIEFSCSLSESQHVYSANGW